jgi:hypothetical protein
VAKPPAGTFRPQRTGSSDYPARRFFNRDPAARETTASLRFSMTLLLF